MRASVPSSKNRDDRTDMIKDASFFISIKDKVRKSNQMGVIQEVDWKTKRGGEVSHRGRSLSFPENI